MELIHHIQNSFLSLSNHEHPTALLGLSGGADSVLLFHALQDLHARKKATLHCVHVNHGWRTTAQRDQDACQALCTAHAIPLTIIDAKEWVTRVSEHKRAHASRESLAREVRRIAFQAVSAQCDADAIVLAHHADDQLETFFIRLMRGSSLTGLCGIHERAGMYIRPLLTLTKQEILKAVDTYGLSFCHDESNDSRDYLRNRIRADVIPAILSCDNRAEKSIHSTITRLQDDDSFLEQIAEDIFSTLADNRGWLPRERFTLLHRALQNRLLLLLLISSHVPFTPSTGLFNEIRRFLESAHGGTHAISKTHSIQKKHGWFGICTE